MRLSYDAAHRLTSESRSGTNSYSKSYTLDGVGNRTAQTVGGTSTSFTYSNDDELTATSGGFANSYSYNANGEQTGRTLSGTAYSLSFDYDGQLTQISQGGSSVSYAYDATGRRYSRTSGGTTTTFQYAGGKVLLEKQGSTTTATYTYGNALIRKDGEVPLFDGLGSERTVTDSTQAVTGTLTTEGFGQTVATTGSSTNPYMFAATSGYRNDGDAGLMHVGARYYDAQVGRFITRDTLLTEHPYIYCNADPVNAVDPSGHDWYYHQGSGSMSRHVGSKVFYIGDGYSGSGGHKNVPGDDNLKDLGPIPRGDYTIGPPNTEKGPITLPLGPGSGNDMHGRDGFLIHGDNPSHPGESSTGCIVLPRAARERIRDSGDDVLHVLP